ncbi:hypothetical protein IBX65_07775, partial [Candidatus Aerophobetes bacterium]|nr:hypothetical protein [Candidatus Aerophobetes bacterium]
MKKNDGYVIVVSLVIATAVLLLLGVFWGTIVAERRNIERSYRSAQALHLAEAGVEEAINNLPSTDSGEINIEGVGNCEYTSIISENLIIIQATGYSPEIAIPGHVKRKVEVTLEKKLFGVFDYAIFADGGGAELIENAYVDSYDSRLGSYASQATTYDSELGRFYANSSATVGTNSILPSAVSLSDFASVYGDAFVGPGGDPSSAISITDNAKITGYQGTMGSGVELPEVIPPASYDFVGGSLKVTST